MVKKTILGAAAVSMAIGAAACQSIAGLDGNFHRGTVSSSSGGGSGGATTSTGTGASSCVPDHPPDPPAVADDGGDIEFVVALHEIDLDEKDYDVTLGLDLDGRCTCTDGADGSCKPIADKICDGPNGIDNALGVIFATVRKVSSNLVTSGQISKGANDGQWTALGRVRGYNGKPDDAKVEVWTYQTRGTSAGMPTPKWDGNDMWPIDDSSLTDGVTIDSPVSKSSEAYVSGGVLVARIPSETFRMRSPIFKMDLVVRDIVFRANIESPSAGVYKLTKGMLGAKWPLTNAFKDMASIRYAGSQKLCTDDPNYITVKSAICGDADLRLDGTDGTCDTLSFGASFSSDPAKLGEVVMDGGPLMDGCKPEADPSTDVCGM